MDRSIDLTNGDWEARLREAVTTIAMDAKDVEDRTQMLAYLEILVGLRKAEGVVCDLIPQIQTHVMLPMIANSIASATLSFLSRGMRHWPADQIRATVKLMFKAIDEQGISNAERLIDYEDIDDDK